MKEEIINGINYRLNGWTKTAEVIKKCGLTAHKTKSTV